MNLDFSGRHRRHRWQHLQSCGIEQIFEKRILSNFEKISKSLTSAERPSITCCKFKSGPLAKFLKVGSLFRKRATERSHHNFSIFSLLSSLLLIPGVHSDVLAQHPGDDAHPKQEDAHQGHDGHDHDHQQGQGRPKVLPLCEVPTTGAVSS